MAERTKHYFKPAVYLVGAILWFTAIYSVYPTLAAFSPGATLDPGCSPGDAGCTVSAPLATDIVTNTNIIMTTSSISFSTSTLFIEPNNNYIGINTTTPGFDLSVYGSLLMDGDDRYINFGYTTSSGGYGIRDNSGAMEYKDLLDGSWSTLDSLLSGGSGEVSYGAGGALAFYSSGGTTVTGTDSGLLFWDSGLSGLGIGTAVPSTSLHVVSTTEQLRLGY